MKPTFRVPPPRSASPALATDRHDSVSRPAVPQSLQADPLSVLFEHGQRLELKTGDWLFRRRDLGRRLLPECTARR